MSLITALINLLLKIIQSIQGRRQEKPPMLVIPHPEEAKKSGVKVADIDIQSLLSDWFVQWEVINKQYFLGVRIELKENLHVILENRLLKVPAATYANAMRMELDPEWANPGVIAHEMAHISYALLSDSQKAEFGIEYNKALEIHELLKFVSSQKPYMRTGGIVEAHADCYRYLGNLMPENLMQFYPNLL